MYCKLLDDDVKGADWLSSRHCTFKSCNPTDIDIRVMYSRCHQVFSLSAVSL